MASERVSDIPLDSLYTSLLPITIASNSSKAQFTNWGQTFHCRPLAVFEPENEYQCELILELARREHKVVRVVGEGHSPSDLACTNDFMLRTERLNQLQEVRPFKCLFLFSSGAVILAAIMLTIHFYRSTLRSDMSLPRAESNCAISTFCWRNTVSP